MGEYLDALEAGHAAAVREHLADLAHASDGALTDDVLRAAAGRVDSHTIDAVRTNGGDTTAAASLSSGTGVETSSFSVRSQAASSFSPATWDLLPVAAAEFVVTVPEGVQELLIDAVLVCPRASP